MVTVAEAITAVSTSIGVLRGGNMPRFDRDRCCCVKLSPFSAASRQRHPILQEPATNQRFLTAFIVVLFYQLANSGGKNFPMDETFLYRMV